MLIIITFIYSTQKKILYLKRKIGGYELECDPVNGGGYEMYLTDKDENFAQIASSILEESVNLEEIKEFEV